MIRALIKPLGQVRLPKATARVTAIAACVVLAACQRQTIPPPDLGPLAVTCSRQCKTPCTPAQWPRWEGDPDAPATWDALPEQVARPLREIAEQCEAARQSCMRCLKGLEASGVICGVGRACNP
jgi:hypothetical protein